MNSNTDYSNGELRKDMRDLKSKLRSTKSDVKQVKQSCDNIVLILQGGEKADEPSGLIHKVFKNTEFRKKTNKILWFITLLLLSLVIEKAFNLLGG